MPFLSYPQKWPKSKHFLTSSRCRNISMHPTTTFKVFKSFFELCSICRNKREGHMTRRNETRNSNATTTVFLKKSSKLAWVQICRPFKKAFWDLNKKLQAEIGHVLCVGEHFWKYPGTSPDIKGHAWKSLEVIRHVENFILIHTWLSCKNWKW